MLYTWHDVVLAIGVKVALLQEFSGPPAFAAFQQPSQTKACCELPAGCEVQAQLCALFMFPSFILTHTQGLIQSELRQKQGILLVVLALNRSKLCLSYRCKRECHKSDKSQPCCIWQSSAAASWKVSFSLTALLVLVCLYLPSLLTSMKAELGAEWKW